MFAHPMILATFLLFAAEIALSQSPRLEFVKKIGVGWSIDKWAWMSFVAFNADGTMIASDAATGRDDVSGSLTLWSFPKESWSNGYLSTPQRSRRISGTMPRLRGLVISLLESPYFRYPKTLFRFMPSAPIAGMWRNHCKGRGEPVRASG